MFKIHSFPFVQNRKGMTFSQRSCLSWQWRVIQNLKRNWLVISKLTWGIWQILTWVLKSLKNFQFNGLFLSKVCIVWVKKSTEELPFMKLQRDRDLERNRLVVSKLTNVIWQVLTWALESLKTFYFNGLLLSKAYIFRAKKVQKIYLS